MLPIALQYLKPLVHRNYTIKIGVYLPFGIYGVHRQTYANRLSVKPKNQNGNFFAGRLDRLLQPFRLVVPAILVMLAFNRMEWNVDVCQIFLLVLVQVTLAAVVNALRFKELIQLFNDTSFKTGALSAA